MAYKFETNATEFDIIFKITDIKKRFFPHVGITAREGISVMYRLTGTQNWCNIDFFFKKPRETIDMSCYVDEGENYEILIYVPIIARISQLEIEVPEGSHISKITTPPNKTMVVVGGPTSYGIGCTSVKNMFSNILERKYDAEVSHVTYNEKNYLESVLDYYNNDYPLIADVGIIELDQFRQNESAVEEILPQLISIMKQRCKYLIGWYAIPESKVFKKIIANNTIKDYVYNNEIQIIDLSYIYDEEHRDMCAYNDYFINDTGNIIIYKQLDKTLRRLPQWNI
ncbi:SGNH/GDSL hydrolase N-terminal domain-containing protein [Methanosphaera sp. ISO3-F5]|uniref:SGNH/GDSL hydrolase N-terminal domain-containing protein n=1 Tax=Methanosphaera sp. ISO3-F5 TaxID=1452353 RepID=UPI002B262E00|nr:SGNH/GDSL hydrolase N-terminal domain-containing protein [Methanosphaera sp. ISO3-F5]WQH63462.1 SGNH/GDSL hydrolase N-terminal domain-containing protein [Methanosphaera sp. ISO3-F5]